MIAILEFFGAYCDWGRTQDVSTIEGEHFAPIGEEI